MRKVLAVCFILLFSDFSFAEDEAEIHLQKMLDKYESLVNYEDNGYSITELTKSDNDKHKNELKFKTKYIENKSLYFEWLDMPNELERQLKMPPGFKGHDHSKPRKYTVWKNKSGIYAKYWFKEKEKLTSLSTALSGATGISSGLAWMVPRYLSPEISCPPNLGANKLNILESNENTVVIELIYESGDIEILHIDINTYLLKKYEEKYRLENNTNIYQVVEFNVIDYK